MIILYYTVIMYAAILENDRVLAIWMLCMAIYSIFNNLLLSVSENAAFLAIWYAAGLLKWHRKKLRIGKRRLKQLDERKQIERAA